MILFLIHYRININMRCIEIFSYALNADQARRLTLTWDVLKSCMLHEYPCLVLRLTLTWDVLKCKYRQKAGCYIKININMRCIEMCIYVCIWCIACLININMRCIEIQNGYVGAPRPLWININMRCIEIAFYDCIHFFKDD